MIRLDLALLRLLQTGEVMVHVGHHHDYLMAVRNGEYSWEEIKAYERELLAQVQIAYENTKLPDYPDMEKIEKWLIETKLAHLDEWRS